MEASNKRQAIVQGLGEEIDALGKLPQGMEQTQQHAKDYFNWLKPQIEKGQIWAGTGSHNIREEALCPPSQ
eukprot:1013353-Karenia_brevis.AAC.1